MKRSGITIGTPVLQIRAVIHHATPRKPTAFERVILSLAGRFVGNDDFGRLSLEYVFEQLLGVSDPKPVVAPTLDELLSLDVIRYSGDPARLNELLLEEVEITERGERMIREDMLPARSMRALETFYYDPLANKLLRRSDASVCDKKPPALHLDASEFKGVFPESLIRAQLKPAFYEWFEEVTVVEHLEPEDVSVLWKSDSVSFHHHDGVLSLDSPNGKLREFLGKLPEGTVAETIIKPAFFVSWQESAALSGLPRLEETDAALIPLPKALESANAEASPIVIRKGCRTGWKKEDSAAARTFIFCDPELESDRLHVSWNKSASQCHIHLAEPNQDRGVIVADESNCLEAFVVPLRYGEENFELIVGRWKKDGETTGSLVDSIIGLIEGSWDEYTEDEKDCLALLLSPAEYLGKRIMHEGGEADDPCRFLGIGSGLIERLCGKGILSDPEALAEFIADGLIDRLPSGDAQLEELKKLVDLLAGDKDLIGGQMTRVQEELARIFPQPESIEQYNAVLQFLRPLNDKWLPEFPSHLFGLGLARDVLERFPGNLRIAGRPNPFAHSYLQLIKGREAIINIIGTDDINAPVWEKLERLSLKASAESLVKRCEDWLAAYDKMADLVSDHDIELKEAPVEIFREAVIGLSAGAKNLIRSKREKGGKPHKNKSGKSGGGHTGNRSKQGKRKRKKD